MLGMFNTEKISKLFKSLVLRKQRSIDPEMLKTMERIICSDYPKPHPQRPQGKPELRLVVKN